jgi:hypothetical protein
MNDVEKQLVETIAKEVGQDWDRMLQALAVSPRVGRRTCAKCRKRRISYQTEKIGRVLCRSCLLDEALEGKR